MEEGLGNLPNLRLIDRDPNLVRVGSSFQFRLPDQKTEDMPDFVARCPARGVELKWFGADEPVAFTSRHDSWTYAGEQHLPKTDAVLATLIDMRLPLTFSLDDCRLIGRIIRECVLAARN